MKQLKLRNRTSFYLLFFFIIPTISYAQQSPARHSATAIRADLDSLYQNLQRAHYNLYLNTPKPVYDKAYQKLRASIKDSMTLLEANRRLQPFTALCGLAHCTIAYPFMPVYGEYVEKGGTLFPADISINQGHIQIAYNYSSDTTFNAGDELLSINNIPAADILDGIYHYLSGENEYFKNTLVDLLHFPRLYWLVYGTSSSYKLVLKKINGDQYTTTVNAVPAMSFEEKSAALPSVFDPGRSFRLMGNVAYLHPGAFSNANSDGNTSEQKTFEKGEFLSFLDASFATLRKSSCTKLLIDLRGNPGGDNSFSDAMIAYFAHTPFAFCSRFSVRTSALTKSFWKDVQDSTLRELRTKILNKPDGEIFDIAIKKVNPKADSLRFKGNVFVLIDRYSYSNAVTTAATIQDYKWGVLMGEPTADVPTTYAAIHEFKLPHTQMSVSYPKAFMVRPNGDRTAKGVQPDIIIKKTPGAADDVLQQALKWIGEN